MNEDFMRVRLVEIPSTNEYAKAKREEGKNLLITAARQSGGRGTKGRSFSSEEGGVYLSRLQFLNIPAKEAFTVMVQAAVAVCKTLCAYRLKPCIKWPNDIHVGGKKICGILIENTLSGNRISASVVGVGLNVRNPLPPELREIATSMALELETPPSVEEVTERLIAELQKPHTLLEYRRFLGYVGREITLLFGDERIPATLLGVTEKGELEIERQGERLEVPAGEVSLRI